MKHLVVKSTGGPLADMKREKCLEAVNELSDTAIKNLSQLINSPKAKEYLENDSRFKKLKLFI